MRRGARPRIVRCGVLLEQATKLKTASQWMDALGKLDFIRRLQTELKLELSAADIKQVEILETWARGERKRSKEP